ncbi:MAG: DUF2279 domain-containing protein [Bacteroidetes bacterium]|nr:DUF2279 domain-containing protein [Bacteroidota bacterium]
MNRCLLFILALLLFFLPTTKVVAQDAFIQNANAFNEKRFTTVIVSEAAFGILLSTSLYFLWYKNHPKSKFHLFNDNGEWLGMDKAGHSFAAYTISNMQYGLMQWCGVNKNNSLVASLVSGIGYLSIVELFDGFSNAWGFSIGDCVANFSGGLLFTAQQWGWNEQRMRLVYSYHFTPLAKINPDLLGKKRSERIIKDYNGQTIWLSINPSTFLPVHSEIAPWLNVSFGYGVHNLIGARKNAIKGESYMALPDSLRTRQFYFSVDGDVTKLNTYNFSPLAKTLSFLKWPAPALEINTRKKIKFHYLYY